MSGRRWSKYATVLDLQCFQALFEIETYLRWLMRWELKGLMGKSWQGGIDSEVLKSAKQRRREEDSLVVVDSRKTGVLSYVSLGDLRDIIVGSLWDPVFSKAFPRCEIVKSDFAKLLGVRNKVAHLRPVSEFDFRLTQRFCEDLEIWTRGYDAGQMAVRRHSLNEEEDPIGLMKEVVNRGSIGLVRQCSVAEVSHHFRMELFFTSKPPQGAVSKLIETLSRFLTVLQSSEDELSLVMYFAKLTVQGDGDEIGDRLQNLIEGNFDSGAPVNRESELLQVSWEEYVPWSVEFPDKFVSWAELPA